MRNAVLLVRDTESLVEIVEIIGKKNMKSDYQIQSYLNIMRLFTMKSLWTL